MHYIEENRIRDRAYQLWEDAGQPDDREQEFWYQAERELVEEDEVDLSAEASALDLPPVVPGRLS
ncbi:DUF2934 domain-containing protein [Devosia sp.]|uniref:DUF2934 domain-containing protein n=1 Tax=Devosia sp. TaxID=1871048 RepID=UPI001AC99580|nr:DUF2934 domain-containing protein [Devosia sp.]MBN9332850.1 DUF2934 domain-containing protein [Devosia sp.]